MAKIQSTTFVCFARHAGGGTGVVRWRILRPPGRIPSNIFLAEPPCLPGRAPVENFAMFTNIHPGSFCGVELSGLLRNHASKIKNHHGNDVRCTAFRPISNHHRPHQCQQGTSSSPLPIIAAVPRPAGRLPESACPHVVWVLLAQRWNTSHCFQFIRSATAPGDVS